MKTKRQTLGAWGESQAAQFLTEKGYDIVERNFRIRSCELDIIAWKNIKDERTLCFIEVKTRDTLDDGSAERATNPIKLKHLFHGAKEFCLQKGISLDSIPIQFEQVSVYKKISAHSICKHYIIPIN